jgi:hypothetical protein
MMLPYQAEPADPGQRFAFATTRARSARAALRDLSPSRKASLNLPAAE